MHCRGSLLEAGEPHLSSKSHPQATCGWRGTWLDHASPLGLSSMGSIKAAAAPHHQLDAYHSASLDQDHQAYHAAAAAAAVHGPLAASPVRSNTAAASAAAKQPSNGIDGTLINQLLLQATADSHSNLHAKPVPSSQRQQQQLLQQLRLPNSSAAHVFDSSALTPPAPGDWRLGTDVQCEVPPAAAPELQEQLSQFPASQHKVLLDSLASSSSPQELLLALQAAAATPDTLGSPLHHQHQQQQALDHSAAPWMHQGIAAAGSIPSGHTDMADLLLHPSTPTAPNSGSSLLQQLQLQASLAAQQAAMTSSVQAAAGSSMSAAQQQLLLQQLQSVAAAASSPSALTQLLQQQMYGQGVANAAAANNLWNLAATGLGTSPSAAAAALAAQQQQSAMSALLAQAALAQQRQQQHSSMLAAGQYYQQLAAQLMASQLAAASGSSSYGSLGANSFGTLGSSAPARAGSAGFGSMPAAAGGSFQRAPSGFSKGRRNSRVLSSSGSSRANSAALSSSTDVFGYLGGGSSSGGSSRASSYAGSDMDSAADNAAAALAAGLNLQDLCPSSYEDTWGAGSSSSSSDTASTWLSSSSTAASLASSPGSSRAASTAAAADWQADDAADNPKPQQNTTATADLAGSGDAVKASKRDQSSTAAAAANSAGKQQLSKVGGCPVWFPGAREASGDDSWYLGCPPTCRLFVGNIGSWVDEDALLSYFGKYGNVVDVQVMWNTKMLARGRRVNREFAFISYASPLEAARAVHWLDGCRLPDLEKDKNGITVEYENGEGEANGVNSSSGGASSNAGAVALAGAR